MKITLIQPLVYTLAGMTAATIYIGDMLRDLGHSVRILAKKPKEHTKYYDAAHVVDYYSVEANLKIIEVDYAAVYGAAKENYSNAFVDCIKSSDAVISFDESLSLLPRILKLEIPFFQFYHFPSKNAPPDIHTKIICNSNYTKNYVNRFYNRDDCVVIHPVPQYKFYNSCAIKDVDILWVGRISRDKNFEALNQLQKHYSQLNIVAAGSHWWAEHTPKEINSHLTVITDAPISVLRDLYGRAKIFLSTKGLNSSPDDPSSYEHFGIGVIEAAYSFAVPLVHQSGGPYVDFLDRLQGTYGYYYNDWGTLFKELDFLLFGKEVRQSLFTEDYAFERACDLYNNALANLGILGFE